MFNICTSTLLGAVCRPWNGRFSYSPGSVNGSPSEDDLSCTVFIYAIFWFFFIILHDFMHVFVGSIHICSIAFV